MKTKMESLVYVNNNVVGVVNEDEFFKSVHGTRHFLHHPPAIAFDVSTLEDAELYGATIVHVYDKDTRTDYFAYISTIREKGFNINRGNGEQIALKMSYWSRNKPPTQQMGLW